MVWGHCFSLGRSVLLGHGEAKLLEQIGVSFGKGERGLFD